MSAPLSERHRKMLRRDLSKILIIALTLSIILGIYTYYLYYSDGFCFNGKRHWRSFCLLPESNPVGFYGAIALLGLVSALPLSLAIYIFCTHKKRDSVTNQNIDAYIKKLANQRTNEGC